MSLINSRRTSGRAPDRSESGRNFHWNDAVPYMMTDMANLTLIYGLRLLPEGEVVGIEDATLKLANGHEAHVTMHSIEGSRQEIERQLRRSLDAFFEFYPEI